MKTEVFGTIEAIGQPKEFASGFRVQEVLIRTSDKSPCVPVQFKGEHGPLERQRTGGPDFVRADG